MEIKTREQLAIQLDVICTEAYKGGLAINTNTPAYREHLDKAQEQIRIIVDALFPKEKTIRHKQLLVLQSDLKHDHCIKTNWGVMRDLVEAAIKEEEAKQ